MWGLVALAALTLGEAATLVKVVILARHGNRAPNPQVPELCPNFAERVLPGYGVPLAALSKVGVAENWESGVFLRKRYVGSFLPETFVADGSVNFFAERMTRNIVATVALGQGMYPDGDGQEGFLPARPNLIPIATTQEGKDELMNCPRDGPCRRKFRADFELWAAQHDRSIYAANVALFDRVSRACGREWILNPGGIFFQGRLKSLTWGVKAVNDAFGFSANEGLDPTMDGLISLEDLAAFKLVAGGMVNGTRFGQPHQLTYWVSDFLPNLFLLSTPPNTTLESELWHRQKFHLFLNHRELIYSIAHILGIPIAFPGVTLDTLPAGCFLGFELYEDDNGLYYKFFWWGPSRPLGPAKLKALKDTGSLLGLYKGGTMIPVAPRGCTPGELCPVKHVERLFLEWTAQTGTYHQLCAVPPFQPFRGSQQWNGTLTQLGRDPVLAFQADVLSTDSSVTGLGLGVLALLAAIAVLCCVRGKRNSYREIV